MKMIFVISNLALIHKVRAFKMKEMDSFHQFSSEEK
ncbi:unnamed protein product [Paramecium primaurelia]|uniref:Uncharacterized protein n=1 Tax=Paramecium primaurelia TaxID=5886 RepID=A0A8S1MJ29_PARPR|nr:unnamed protein product [Paramecium primaurelia]